MIQINMDMPKGCGECPIPEEDGSEMWCRLIRSYVDRNEHCRDIECPLMETHNNKPKYSIDETVSFYNYSKSIKTGVISMITVTRKGIRYRIKCGYDNQNEVWEDDILGGAK